LQRLAGTLWDQASPNRRISVGPFYFALAGNPHRDRYCAADDDQAEMRTAS